MNKEEAQQVFDGAMLSDAGVYFAHGGGTNEQAYFELGLSGWKHDDWLKEVSIAIDTLGAGSSLSDITYTTKVATNGKPYEYCHLKTRTHPLFTFARRRWYVDGTNIIPKDFSITPLLLAHWFTGDGDSVWGASGLPNSVEARLGTYRYSAKEVDNLRTLLAGFNLDTSLEIRKGIKHGAGLRIRIRNATSVNRFMDLVEPYILPSYRYKIKRPWLRKRGPSGSRQYVYRWVSEQWQQEEM